MLAASPCWIARGVALGAAVAALLPTRAAAEAPVAGGARPRRPAAARAVRGRPETVIVTASRTPAAPGDVPAAVTVIDRARIRRGPAGAADDLVRAAPVAATFRRGSSLVADPSSQGLNLRGVGPSGVSRALVLRDGMPLNDPFGGWVYWRALPLVAIQRVEIAPSGSSALFGNRALGGVLQLFSRPVLGPAVEASLSRGSYATTRGTVRATGRPGPVGLELVAEALDSEGFAPVAPADRGAVDGAAPSRHVALGGRAELSARRGFDLAVHGRLFDERLDPGTRFASAGARTGDLGLTAAVAGEAGRIDAALFGGLQRFTQTRARVDEDRSAAAPSARQRVPSDSQGVQIGWTAPPARWLGQHVVLVGVDALRVAGTSSEELSPPGDDPAAIVRRSAGGEQRFAGVYLQDQVGLPRGLAVSVAARVDAWRDVAGRRSATTRDGDAISSAIRPRGDVQVDPRIGVVQRLGDAVALRASGYRSFRAPTLNELYRPFQVGTVLTEANEDLRPESLWGAEAGPELQVGPVAARAIGWWNRVRDPIQNVTLDAPGPGGAARQRQNLGAARVRGVDLSAAVVAGEAWSAELAYSVVQPVVTAAPGHPELIGRDLPQDPRHRLTAMLAYDDPRIVAAAIQVRLLGRQFEDDLNQLPMARAWLVDARVARELGGGLSVFAGAENLLDRSYLVGRAGVDTRGAPRMVHVGLAFAAGPP